MFAKLRNVVLWKYEEATPDATLRRHYRVARWTVRAWTASTVLMLSCYAEVVILRGSSIFLLVALAVTTALSLVLTIPSLVAMCWATEIERTMARRGFSIPYARSIGYRIGIAAMKMVFFVVILVLAVHFLPEPTSWPYTPP
jgi:hypothetical protein